jgi:hypothetical protein
VRAARGIYYQSDGANGFRGNEQQLTEAINTPWAGILRPKENNNVLSRAAVPCGPGRSDRMPGHDNNTNTSSVTTSTNRLYNGTASVGDFLTVTLNPTAQTISYDDITNGETGTAIPYTVNADGSYAIADPTGNLVAAYEVPGYALLIEANKVGPSQNTMALVTAVESGPISLSALAGTYNYMQFRTSSGGVNVGSVTVTSASATNTSYWPFGEIDGDNDAFGGQAMPLAGTTLDPSGTFITMPDPGGSGNVTVFGTANGFFVVDTPQGSILGLPQAATSAFNPSYAGTYSGILYEKTNVTPVQGSNGEVGTPAFDKVSLVVQASGAVNMTDGAGNTLATGTLTPVADASYLYNGSGAELTNPCNGMFTVRINGGGMQKDFFYTFVNNNGTNAVLFSKFWAPAPWTAASRPYNYFYGVGLMQP